MRGVEADQGDAAVAGDDQAVAALLAGGADDGSRGGEQGLGEHQLIESVLVNVEVADPVVAEAALVEDEQVAADTPAEGVVALAAHQYVVLGSTIEGIVATATEQDVVAVAPVQQIVAGASFKPIVAALAEDQVAGGGAFQDVCQLCAFGGPGVALVRAEQAFVVELAAGYGIGRGQHLAHAAEEAADDGQVAQGIGQAGFELDMFDTVQFLEAITSAGVVEKQAAIAQADGFVAGRGALEENFVVASAGRDYVGTRADPEAVVAGKPVEEVIVAAVLQFVVAARAEEEGRGAEVVGGRGLFVADPGEGSADRVEVADDDGAIALDVVVERRLADALDGVDENTFDVRDQPLRLATEKGPLGQVGRE